MSENKESPTVLRLKRRCCSDPLEGLYLIASKKSKHESSEIFFKFAATVNSSEKESVKDHIQAAIVKASNESSSKWRDPKIEAISERTPANVRRKLRGKHKEESAKKRLDLLNTRRLIFAEDVPIEDMTDDISQKDSETSRLFKLYDIIEESEEAKSQVNEEISSITLNGKPMISEKVDKFVYDFYISENTIDESFVEHAISMRPCFPKDNSIEMEDSDAEEDIYEDDDDSNDENNWRNDYPDESSHSEKESENETDEYGDDSYGDDLREAMNHFNIDEDEDSHEKENAFHYSRLLKELKQDYEDSD